MPTARSRVAASAAGIIQTPPRGATAGTELPPCPLDAPEQVELGPTVGTAHHVIQGLKTQLLRPFAAGQRLQRFRAGTFGSARGPAGGEPRRVQLTQPRLGHHAVSSVVSHPTPSATSRSLRSASPR